MERGTSPKSQGENVLSFDVQVLRDELERLCQGGFLQLVERMENSMLNELKVLAESIQEINSKPQAKDFSVYKDGTLLGPTNCVDFRSTGQSTRKDAGRVLLARKSIKAHEIVEENSSRRSYLMPPGVKVPHASALGLGLVQSSPVPSGFSVPENTISDYERDSYASIELNLIPEEPEEVRNTGCFDLQAFICSDTFDYAVGGLILLNSLSIGYQANYSAVHWTDDVPLFFTALGHIFNWIFFFELALRFYAYGNTFLSYASRNVLDCVIVIAGMSDEVFTVLVKGGQNHLAKGLSILRVVRVLRLIRIMRLARVLILFGELRVLVASVMDSMKALAWTLFLILLLTYTFAVYVTQLITDHKMNDRGETFSNGNGEELLKSFGSVPQSMLSLYEAILGGVDWGEMIALVMKYCSVFDSIILISYMTFSTLALMNVVTATFVASAMKNGDEDRRTILGKQMTQFFNDADDDESGTITWEEFSAKIEDPALQTFLREMDLRPNQAKALYRLLDEDTTGDVAIEDLVSGCLRLHGAAKSIDLLSFVRASEHQWIKSNVDIGTVNENVINAIVALNGLSLAGA